MALEALAIWADSNNSAMSSDLESDPSQDSNYSFSDSDIYSQTTNDSYRTADYDIDESLLLGREGKRCLPPHADHFSLLFTTY